MTATTERHLTVDRAGTGIWTVSFSNPPINMLAPSTIVELHALLSEADTDPSAKVLIFESADPDFFIAHFDTARAADMPRESGPGGLSPWIDVVLRLSRTSVVSIAKIRGRARGVGSELALACDMRFASRRGTALCNPEIGVGLPPGGGAMEWLPRLAGRARTLEIVLSGNDYDADLAERYGWINRALDDDALDGFVDALATRIASFDRSVVGALKDKISRIDVPTAAELEESNALFWTLLASDQAKARRSSLGRRGYGLRSDFELNFARYLPDLKPQQP